MGSREWGQTGRRVAGGTEGKRVWLCPYYPWVPTGASCGCPYCRRAPLIVGAGLVPARLPAGAHEGRPYATNGLYTHKEAGAHK